MTWRELCCLILDEQKDTDVTVYDKVADEYFRIEHLDFEVRTDVLDKGHPFIVLERNMK